MQILKPFFCNIPVLLLIFESFAEDGLDKSAQCFVYFASFDGGVRVGGVIKRRFGIRTFVLCYVASLKISQLDLEIHDMIILLFCHGCQFVRCVRGGVDDLRGLMTDVAKEVDIGEFGAFGGFFV